MFDGTSVRFNNCWKYENVPQSIGWLGVSDRQVTLKYCDRATFLQSFSSLRDFISIALYSLPLSKDDGLQGNVNRVLSESAVKLIVLCSLGRIRRETHVVAKPHHPVSKGEIWLSALMAHRINLESRYGRVAYQPWPPPICICRTPTSSSFTAKSSRMVGINSPITIAA